MMVLLRIRSDVKKYPGGDYIHLQKTREALERRGISCIVSPGLDPMPSGIDIVHLFNTTRIHETFLQFREARRRGVPVVLTPIWHSTAEMERFYQRLYGLPWLPIQAYLGAKEIRYARRSQLAMFWPATFQFRELQREVVRGCDALLPNSKAELRILGDELAVQPRASFVVPLGFEPLERSNAPVEERRDLLCVGRIEPRKNQLEVARAFRSRARGKDRLLFYGSVNHSHRQYWKQVQKHLRDGELEYRGFVPQEEIFAAYARAKGAILASFFETCGLAALEAIACGAKTCVSDTLYTREFYQDSVTYCDPFSSESIACGIDDLLAKVETPPPARLPSYSWDEVAEQTVEAYNYVLSSRADYVHAA